MNILAISVCLTLACATPALANVEVEESTSNYDLRGVTKNEIHESILSSAPREDGNIVDAEIKENVTFTLGYKTTDGTCRVASDQVKLEIVSASPGGSTRTARRVGCARHGRTIPTRCGVMRTVTGPSR